MKKWYGKNSMEEMNGKRAEWKGTGKRTAAALAAALTVIALTGCGTSPQQTQNTTAAAAGTTAAAETAAVQPQSTETTAAAQAGETTAAAVKPQAAGAETAVTEEAAQQTALDHAGLTAEDVTFLHTHLDRDDGRLVYDVEFYSGSSEYDYEIDAQTGEIVSYDYDVESYNPAAGTGQSQTDGYISEADARNAALTHAGLAEADVTFVKTHLDRDDGRTVYDVEFYSGSSEYDYEIDAVSGEVISFDYDAESYQMAPQAGQDQSGDYITVDEAKAAAFSHAGVAEADTSRLEVEMDRDDGRTVYEIEFHVGWTEYSYEIDAVTGQMLSYDMDND